MCIGQPTLVVFQHSDGIHYRYDGQVNKNEELRSSLPPPSYGIVDMGYSDLILLLNKISVSINAEWGRICSTYIKLS